MSSVGKALLHCWEGFVTLMERLCYIVGKALLHCWEGFVTLLGRLCYIVGKALLHFWEGFVTLLGRLCYIVGAPNQTYNSVLCAKYYGHTSCQASSGRAKCGRPDQENICT
jgi:hypothetical protein